MLILLCSSSQFIFNLDYQPGTNQNPMEQMTSQLGNQMGQLSNTASNLANSATNQMKNINPAERMRGGLVTDLTKPVNDLLMNLQGNNPNGLDLRYVTKPVDNLLQGVTGGLTGQNGQGGPLSGLLGGGQNGGGLLSGLLGGGRQQSGQQSGLPGTVSVQN